MTSCSAAIPERRGLWRLQILTALLTVAVGAACDRPLEQREVGVELVRATSRVCRGSGAGAPLGSMDTYTVQLFEVLTPDEANGQPNFCQRCFWNPTLCRLRAERCRCGERVRALPENLFPAVETLRFDDVGTSLFCLRVIALDSMDARGGADAGTRANDCACDPDWQAQQFLRTSGRLCAMGSARAVGPVPFRLEVRCPNDVVETGSLFNACLLPRLEGR